MSGTYCISGKVRYIDISNIGGSQRPGISHRRGASCADMLDDGCVALRDYSHSPLVPMLSLCLLASGLPVVVSGRCGVLVDGPHALLVSTPARRAWTCPNSSHPATVMRERREGKQEKKKFNQVNTFCDKDASVLRRRGYPVFVPSQVS